MTQPPGVTIFCDPTLRPALCGLDGLARARLGASLSVLCAPSALMLAQLQRGTRNDILFTLGTAMDQAARNGLIQPATRSGGWSNKIVLAALRGRVAPPANQAALASLLISRRLAVTDPTVAADLDGRAVLAANLLPTGARITGVANTWDVAFLLANDNADLGLLYATDIAADPRLATVAVLAASPDETSYACALSVMANSPNAMAVLNLLHGPDAQASLRAAGLEIAA